MLQSNRPRLSFRASPTSTMTAVMLAAIMGGNMSAAAEGDASVVGRWRERAQGPAQQGLERIGAIDIAPCAGGYCGVLVDSNGGCGAIILRMTINPQWRGTSNGESWSNFPGILTWRGKSAFTRECEKRGIKQVVASPRRPQTLGKIERFWGTLWRECAQAAIFLDLEDARKRIGLFIDHYNFQRPHQGIDGLAPADRFFGAAQEMLATLQARVAANALELARHGVPRPPFYMAGQVAVFGSPAATSASSRRMKRRFRCGC